MLKLCGFAVSNYYNKAKIALLEKGVPFVEEHCMVSQEPAILVRLPMGNYSLVQTPIGAAQFRR